MAIFILRNIKTKQNTVNISTELEKSYFIDFSYLDIITLEVIIYFVITVSNIFVLRMCLNKDFVWTAQVDTVVLI